MLAKGSLLALVHDVVDDSALTSDISSGPRQVITLAPWQLWLASRSPDFAAAVRAADAVTIDGRWLKVCLDLAGLEYPLVTGRNVVQWHYAGNGDERITVVGSSGESLDKLQSTHPDWLCIGGDFDGFPSDKRMAEIVQRIKSHRSSLVFVALGSPKQERWGRQIADLAEVTVVGIGGSIETAVGLKRAPSSAFQSLGLEWLQRTIQDPKRFAPRIVQALSILPRLLLEACRLRMSDRR